MPWARTARVDSSAAVSSAAEAAQRRDFRVIARQCTVAGSRREGTGVTLSMATFERRTLRINGIDTVLLEGGEGPTLVYLHGAGTVTGFDFAHQWAKKFRVLIPYHPGFGASADDPAVITEIHDYVLHYVELFDQLGLARFKLVGQSMGGYIAVKFAIEHRGLVEKLALACPIGIPAAEPTVDFLKTPPENLPALLAHD